MQRAVAKRANRTATRRAPGTPTAPVAPAGGESKAKLTRYDPDVWAGVALYAKTAGVNDTQAINDLLRVALHSVATGSPNANPGDVHSAPTVAFATHAGSDTGTRLIVETMERMLCTSIGLLAELGEPGRPPRVSAENRAYAKRVRDDCRDAAERALTRQCGKGAA